MSLRSRTTCILAGGLLALSFTGAPTLAAEPSADDPVATVNSVLDTLIAKDFGGIAPLVCAQYREAVATRFDLTQAFADMPETVDVDALFAGLTLSMDPREVTLLSNDGATALVAVVGTLRIAVEDSAAREFVRQILESQGQDTSDATVDALLPRLTDQFAEGEDLTEDVDMLFENGAWLVCEAFGDDADPSPSPAMSPAVSPSASPIA